MYDLRQRPNIPASSKVPQPLKTQIVKEAECQKLLANHGIKWQLMTERAPWWGGFYERMIGLMKRRLKKTIGRASLNAVELATMLTEIEATRTADLLHTPMVISMMVHP